MTVVVHSNAGSQRKRTIPPFLLYIAQLFGVYPITLLAGMPLFFVFAKLGIDGSHGDGVNFAGFGALICLFMGALLGHIFGIRWPSLVPTGRWVWAAVTLFVAFDLVLPLLRSQFPLSYFEYVYASGDNEGLGVAFVTLPLSAVIGYSTGISIASKERGSAGKRLKAFAVWVSMFALRVVSCCGLSGLWSEGTE